MAFEPKEPQKEIKYKEARIYSDAELHITQKTNSRNSRSNTSTPMCDDLEKGPWPSFVADAKRAPFTVAKLPDNPHDDRPQRGRRSARAAQLSYEHGETHLEARRHRWACSVTAAASSVGTPISRNSSRLSPTFTPCVLTKPGSYFYNTTISELFAICGSTGEAG